MRRTLLAIVGFMTVVAACGEDSAPPTGEFAVEYAIVEGSVTTKDDEPVTRATVAIFISDPGCETPHYSVQTTTLDTSGAYR